MDAQDIAVVLGGLDWTDDEASLYVALIELGPQPASVVAKHVDRPRVTVFHALERMAKKGMVRTSPHPSGTRFHATEPSALVRRMEEEHAKREAEGRLRLRTLESLVPQLEAIGAKDAVRPRVQVFHGENALKDIYALSLLGKEMYAYFSPWSSETEKNLRAIDDWHTAERVKKKIPVKIIIPDTREGKAFAAVSKDGKNVRLVPHDLFPHQDVTLITDTHFLLFSVKDGLGIAIESAYVAANQRAIFTLAWQGATALSS
jgi:sugar-specific transcriptional regulator TrmB